MITLWHSSINWIKEDEIRVYLASISSNLKTDITKYHRVVDQKSALIARLMLRNCLICDGKPHLLEEWRRDKHQKPYIPGWSHFNISHSGDLVVLACNDSAVGVDIEQIFGIDFTELKNIFHSDEVAFISSSENSPEAFFQLWTRKEALLKAIGIGLSEELNKVNCRGDYIVYKGINWYFHQFTLHPGYVGNLCSRSRDEHITIKEYIPHLPLSNLLLSNK